MRSNLILRHFTPTRRTGCVSTVEIHEKVGDLCNAPQTMPDNLVQSVAVHGNRPLLRAKPEARRQEIRRKIVKCYFPSSTGSRRREGTRSFTGMNVDILNRHNLLCVKKGEEQDDLNRQMECNEEVEVYLHLFSK